MAEAQKAPARPWTPTERPGDESYASPVRYHGDHVINKDDDDYDISSAYEENRRPELSPGVLQITPNEIPRPGPLRFRSSQALRDDAAASAPEVQVYRPFRTQDPDTPIDEVPRSLRPQRSFLALKADRGNEPPTNDPYRLSQIQHVTSNEGPTTVHSQRSSEALATKEHDDARLPLNNPYRSFEATRSESTEGLPVKPEQLSQDSRAANVEPGPSTKAQRPLQPSIIKAGDDLPSVTGTMSEPIKILLINPNSTKSMTERCLESIAGSLTENVIVYGYTASRPAPTAIESQTDAVMSTSACMKDILPVAAKYDGFLVACFSHHPLIAALREQLTQPVIGIMEASLYAARMCGSKLGIVTTGIRSMLLHDASVKNVYGLGSFSVGTESSRLGVLELESRPGEEVQERLAMAARKLQMRGADCICLGCAGMTDLQKACQEAVGMHDRVAMVIDGVALGVHFLVGLVRESLGTAKGGAYNNTSRGISVKLRG